MKLSRHDPALILRKMRQVEFRDRIRPFALSKGARVRSRWAGFEQAVRHWYQIPEVVRRVNERITGDPNQTFKDFVCRQYFSERRPRTALSLGCGDGSRELDWARRGVFARLIGLDLSSARIAAARKAAAEAHLTDVLDFRVADVSDLRSEDDLYDVIIFEHSLHHFERMPEVLEKVRSLLHPQGLLLADEFIGPRRFQWTAPQLTFADALLLSIPEKYRRLSFSSGVKRRNLRAGEFLMWLNDPSEAVESDRIEPEILRQFRVLHRFDYGGTVSHLLFQDIAHHFATGEGDAVTWATRVLDAEDTLLRLGILTSDFACFVCSPP